MSKKILLITTILLVGCQNPVNKVITEEEKISQANYDNAHTAFTGLENNQDGTFTIINSGKGYFALTDLKREKYYFTKNGNFTLNKKREIVLANNQELLFFPEIKISFGKTLKKVNKSGRMFVLDENNPQESLLMINFLSFNYFAHPDKLNEVNNGIYEKTKDSGEPILIALYSCCDNGLD
jgi:flagellar basal body rod protein FlgG